ncbi:activated RNA polymerase II transcriptional coactivator p15-like [Gigantopelta aegis]|uniref:activated RNA polymerase II transcriptional coactivator p15-like n=1 Tax=Gigantopelta aegis TaxID=1735272 RepID=UPI001B88DFAC|nr:activated RNA polymerase II transcriptional coactivator p15-like [Gigantopelta aegis]
MPKSKELISSDDDSGSDTEPKPKKKKVEKKPEKKEEIKPDKKSSKTSAGENMFQLSRMRFATVSEFRGKVMVGIREYYEADGDLRPGRKGISLTLEQWKSLKDQMDDIDEAIKDLE